MPMVQFSFVRSSKAVSSRDNCVYQFTISKRINRVDNFLNNNFAHYRRCIIASILNVVIQS